MKVKTTPSEKLHSGRSCGCCCQLENTTFSEEKNRKYQHRSPHFAHRSTSLPRIGLTTLEEKLMEKIAAKLGAVLYVCWGLLHFTAAYGVFKLAQNSPANIAHGRLMQTAF